MSRYQWAIEELCLSGSISLGNCSAQTVYRWTRKISEILERGNYDWRVKPEVKTRSISVV